MSLHFLGSIELDDGFISGNDSEHFFLINVLRTLGFFSWWLLARLEWIRPISIILIAESPSYIHLL